MTILIILHFDGY